MTTLLVDGNNLLMRAVFATQRSSMSADGVATGPLVVFVNTLTKHIREERPSRVAIAWDGGKSAQRTQLDPGYKGNRTSAPDEDVKKRSFALVKEFLALADIYQAEIAGYEADDLISSWWYSALDGPLVILSSDKDFLQLLGQNPCGQTVEQVRLSSADTPTDRWNLQRMLDDVGYGPVDWASVTALTGDKSDNVIGVPGIGPKKAVKLLTAHGWNLRDAAASLPEHRDQILLNLQLVSLRNPTLRLGSVPPFRPSRRGAMLYDQLLAFLDRYQLASVRDRLESSLLWNAMSGHQFGVPTS